MDLVQGNYDWISSRVEDELNLLVWWGGEDFQHQGVKFWQLRGLDGPQILESLPDRLQCWAKYKGVLQIFLHLVASFSKEVTMAVG